MLKRCFSGLMMGLLFKCAVLGQASGKAKPPLTFEVASVKVAAPPERAPAMGRSSVAMTIDDARVSISSATLAELINLAFKVRSYQVSGPAWLNPGMMSPPQRFTVQAKMPDGVTKEQVPEMLQALLADRFKLAFHREEKEQSVYALVVGKSGPKLKEIVADEPGGTPPAPQVTGNIVRMERDMPIDGLVDLASRFLDRPVVDLTDLKGKYHMAIDLSTDDMRTIASRNGNPAAMDGGGKPADAAADPTGGTIFQSVQAMGLRLESRKMPVARIVIERLEKTPTEN